MQRISPPLDRAALDARDALVVDRWRYTLAAEPLAAYFALTGASSPFAGTATGNGRGYSATWELLAGRLYLIGITGTRAGGGVGTLADLFPEFDKRVFAHWYSGTLVATRPRPAIGAVVLDGIDVGAAATFSVEIERGILLAATSSVPPRGTSRPAEPVTA